MRLRYARGIPWSSSLSTLGPCRLRFEPATARSSWPNATLNGSRSRFGAGAIHGLLHPSSPFEGCSKATRKDATFPIPCFGEQLLSDRSLNKFSRDFFGTCFGVVLCHLYWGGGGAKRVPFVVTSMTHALDSTWLADKDPGLLSVTFVPQCPTD